MDSRNNKLARLPHSLHSLSITTLSSSLKFTPSNLHRVHTKLLTITEMEEDAGNGGSRKRVKLSDDEGKGDSRDGTSLDNTIENEETETKLVASDEMELNIAQILDKIESFTQTISNLLESGKTLFKDLSNEFEERLIMIHKEHIEKWQEEIKELRLLDASNEETTSILHNARYLLQNPSIEP